MVFYENYYTVTFVKNQPLKIFCLFKGEKGTVTRPKFCRGLVDPKKNVVSTEKIGHFVTLCMLLSVKRQKIYTIFQRKEMYLLLIKTKKRLPMLPK